jgi:hypothetical protein
MAALIEEVRAGAGLRPSKKMVIGRWSMVARDFRTANNLTAGNSSTIMQFFSARDSPGDFGTPLHASVSIIFLLTSFCVDSIHSTSCNKTSLRNSMKNGKGE